MISFWRTSISNRQDFNYDAQDGAFAWRKFGYEIGYGVNLNAFHICITLGRYFWLSLSICKLDTHSVYYTLLVQLVYLSGKPQYHSIWLLSE